MKAKELLEHSKCSFCKKPIGHTGLPLFWTINVERHGIKMDAVRRYDGLAAFMGSQLLADAMGPDEEMTLTMCGPVEFTVCENCLVESWPLLMSETLVCGVDLQPTCAICGEPESGHHPQDGGHEFKR